MRDRDPEFEAFVERARAGDFETAIALCGFRPAKGKERALDRSGPCPACGGTDRFSVHIRKRKFNCRKCGVRGSNALGLALVGDKLSYIEACEALTNEARPSSCADETETQRAERLARMEQAERDRKAKAEREAEENLKWRERARDNALKIWDAAIGWRGTLVEAYLAHRKLAMPDDEALRFGMVPYYPDGWKPGDQPLFTGPAMLALIIVPIDGKRVRGGVHITWLDPALGSGAPILNKGKRVMPLKPDGEPMPAKKVRGWQRGGYINLCAPASGAGAERLVIGEGIETVLAARAAVLAAYGPKAADAHWKTSVSLGNLAGKARGRIAHPIAKVADKNGRLRAVMVQDGEPDPFDDLAFEAPASIRDMTILADADGDLFSMQQAMRRAEKRHAKPGRLLRVAWPAAGRDFNDEVMAAERAAA